MSKESAIEFLSGDRTKVVVFTSHFVESKRRANIHWIVQELIENNCKVLVVAVGVSRLSIRRGDRRSSYLNDKNENRIEQLSEDLFQICIFTNLHVFNARNRLLNILLWPLSWVFPKLSIIGKCGNIIKGCDVILVESGLPLLYVSRLRKQAISSKLIYRVSDDVAHLRCHPAVAKAERTQISSFDLISVPSRALQNKLSNNPNVVYHPHALPKEILDKKMESPFSEKEQATLKVVSVGSSFFDYDALNILVKDNQEIQFYVIGDVFQRLLEYSNVSYLGELPFGETVRYIKYCQVGLALYDEDKIGPGLLETSNKIAQFRYYGKPVVTPQCLVDASVDDSLFGYRNAESDSINRALRSASTCKTINRVSPKITWNKIVTDMLAV